MRKRIDDDKARIYYYYSVVGVSRGGDARGNAGPTVTGSKDVAMFAALARSTGISERDGSTHLVTLRCGEKYYGFRSHAAGGKLLQARTKVGRLGNSARAASGRMVGVAELCFCNYSFGKSEQWELVRAEDEVEHQRREGSLRGRAMKFRNRHMRDVYLHVRVVPVEDAFVPAYARDDMAMYDDDLMYLDIEDAREGLDSAATATVVTTAIKSGTSWESPKSSYAANLAPARVESALVTRITDPPPRKNRGSPERKESVFTGGDRVTGAPSEKVLETWSQLFRDEVQVRHGVEKDMRTLRAELQLEKTRWMNSIQAVQLEFESISLEAMKTLKAVLEKKTAKEMLVIKMKMANRLVRGNARLLRDAIFRKWKTHAEHARRRRVSMIRFMLRANKRGVDAAFDAWKTHTLYMRTLRRKDAYARERVEKKQLRVHFAQWREVTSESQHARVIAARAHRRGVADKDRELKLRVIEAWYFSAKRSQTVLRLQLRAVAKLRNRVVVDSFDAWRGSVAEKRKFAQRLIRIFRMWDERLVERSFNKWRELTAEAIELKSARNRLLAVLLKRAVLSHQMRLERSSFDVWRLDASRAAAYRRAITKVLMRIQRLHLAKSFAGWANRVKTRKSQRRTLVLIVQRWRNRSLAAAWTQWHSITTVNSRKLFEKSLMARKQMQKERLRRAFAEWRAEWRKAFSHAIKRRTANRFASLNYFFKRWNNLVEFRRNISDMVVAKRVVQNRFMDWYWDVYGEDFITILKEAKADIEIIESDFLPTDPVPVKEASQPIRSLPTHENIFDEDRDQGEDEDTFFTPRTASSSTTSTKKLFWSPPKPRRLL